MPFPEGLALQPVQAGAAITVLGRGASLVVRATPMLDGKPVTLTHDASGTALVPLLETIRVEGGAAVIFDLPAVDQPGILGPDGQELQDWYYAITMQAYRIEPWDGALGLPAGAGRQVELPPRVYEIQPRMGDELLDLDKVGASGWVRPPMPNVYVGPVPPVGVPRPLLWLDTSDPTIRTLNLVQEG